MCLGATALLLASAEGAEAQDASAFHEIETKYIFGNFTVGAAIGIEGEVAIEPETEANFGKRFGRYAASGTAVELEYTPTHEFHADRTWTLVLLIQHPEVSAGLSNQNMGGVNGFKRVISDFSSSTGDRRRSQ